MKSKTSVQEILADNKSDLPDWSFTTWHLRTLGALRRCRTSALGGHIDSCTHCNKLHISYNSCRNRHCPRCESHKTEQWIMAREKELLNTSYYHLVFTLPSELHEVSLKYSKEVYAALFKSSWSTLEAFGKQEMGIKVGMIAVLHTWGQNLSLHPHLHCIVPSGGVDRNGLWKSPKKRNFLFPVRAMSKMFRAKMVAELRSKKLPISSSTYTSLFGKNWVVYAKKAFGKPEYVVEYLGRYTHKIAISNARLQDYDRENKLVHFTAKNYKKGGKKQMLVLKAKEFIKRFQLHILPKGFTRIRHYGILSSSWKKKKLPDLQEVLGKRELTKNKPEKKDTHLQCRSCKLGRLKVMAYFGSRGPPDRYAHLLKI